MDAYNDREGSNEGMRNDSTSDVHFTCFVRLPFRRQDFVDPPLVDWNTSKDHELWKILSNNPRTAELDWRALAGRFDVSLPFILQQAAWLYERQLSQVRAQMRKVGKSNAPSPALGPGSFSGGHSMQRQISAEGGSRMSTGTTMSNRLSFTPTAEGSLPGTPKPKKPPISRNISTTTVTQSHLTAQRSPRLLSGEWYKDPQTSPPGTQQPSKDTTRSPAEATQKSPSPPPDNDSSTSSSSESDEEEPTIRASQTFRRTPRFMSGKKPLQRNQRNEDSTNDDDDEEADSPTFLPFSNPPQTDLNDLGATIRGNENDGLSLPKGGGSDQAYVTRISTTESSTSSASSAAAPTTFTDAARSQRKQASFSPQQRAEIAQLNARKRAAKKEGSDGTPSMGSSFSDLDDASVTQSALEEALLSNMGDGSSASRFSTIGQALKSKYI